MWPFKVKKESEKEKKVDYLIRIKPKRGNYIEHLAPEKEAVEYFEKLSKRLKDKRTKFLIGYKWIIPKENVEFILMERDTFFRGDKYDKI